MGALTPFSTACDGEKVLPITSVHVLFAGRLTHINEETFASRYTEAFFSAVVLPEPYLVFSQTE
jgi:hypothetical protein